MIYFDNAATCGFRPNQVISTAENAIRYISANPGRSGHKLSILGEEFIYRTRKKLSEMFNNNAVERVIFTKNCTEALNIAIFGLYKENTNIVSTVTEHNSVLRPLYALKRKFNTEIRFAKPDNMFCGITAENILPLIDDNTSIVVVNYASNVNGQINEIEKIGNAIKKLNKNIKLIVDGAQAVGHIKIDIKKCNISALAIAGHKGLYALPGASALIFDNETEVAPLLFGGSGTESFDEIPSCYPELLEAGTLNLPSIASLYDGSSYAENMLDVSEERLNYFTTILINALNRIKGYKVFSKPNPFGIVAFTSPIPSTEAAISYDENYNIALRGGFHCAPKMHQFLQTDSKGLLRVSLASQNTEEEINHFIIASKKESSIYFNK